jgi:hypothetical protein
MTGRCRNSQENLLFPSRTQLPVKRRAPRSQEEAGAGRGPEEGVETLRGPPPPPP